MKIRTSYILVLIAMLLAGIAFHFRVAEVPCTAPEQALLSVAEEPVMDPLPPVQAVPVHVSTNKPAPVEKPEIAAPAKKIKPVPHPQKGPSRQYWERQAQIFTQQQNNLIRERNPAKRQQLIQMLARYARIDTLHALDWAMNLEDPAERRKALEAINRNSLTGIGARIEVDQSGLPKIRETTILSALESTGLVEPGDYISGMVNPDGTVVDFQDLPLQQIVNYLRGKPGTETRLMMQRRSAEGVPYYFDVPVQRSLIVMQPPF